MKMALNFQLFRLEIPLPPPRPALPACAPSDDRAGHPPISEHPQDLLPHPAGPAAVHLHLHVVGRRRGHPPVGEQRRPLEVG